MLVRKTETQALMMTQEDVCFESCVHKVKVLSQFTFSRSDHNRVLHCTCMIKWDFTTKYALVTLYLIMCEVFGTVSETQMSLWHKRVFIVAIKITINPVR